jgi:hypothetical protein
MEQLSPPVTSTSSQHSQLISIITITIKSSLKSKTRTKHHKKALKIHLSTKSMMLSHLLTTIIITIKPIRLKIYPIPSPVPPFHSLIKTSHISSLNKVIASKIIKTYQYQQEAQSNFRILLILKTKFNPKTKSKTETMTSIFSKDHPTHKIPFKVKTHRIFLTRKVLAKNQALTNRSSNNLAGL